MKKIYVFDIDGVICNETLGDYENAVPFKEHIRKINELYNKGHKIIIYTGRGSKTGKDWITLTRQQLKKWEVKYHYLKFGKLVYDVWIDDKAMDTYDFFKI